MPAIGDAMQTVLVIGGGEITDARLMGALAAHPDYTGIILGRTISRDNGSLRNHDATKTADIATALAGVDMVVNCIAGNPRTILATTKALCDAARRNPPRRIVHLSSMTVYGGAEGLVDEQTRPEPPLNTYARARIECEDLVRKYVADGGDAVIVRPSCVFGPGSEPWASRIARLLSARRLGDLGSLGDGVCNLIHVDDLVGLMVAMLSASGVSGETFNASADWPRPTWNEFLIRFARAIGATPVERISARRMQAEVKLLAPLLRGAALAAGRVGAGRLVPDAMTPSFVRLLRQNITVSGAKLATRLDITHTPLDRAIDETAEWWRSRQTAAANEPATQVSRGATASCPHSAAMFRSVSRPTPDNEVGR
ncbi:MAG TPA: NAD-dependent epimerase/dehydratase family protein [Acetobacteraceae bacterium]|nr:NAD-dependent epimerase/dehydratase family protein [Acetobacteraceae bacterium]